MGAHPLTRVEALSIPKNAVAVALRHVNAESRETAKMVDFLERENIPLWAWENPVLRSMWMDEQERSRR